MRVKARSLGVLIATAKEDLSKKGESRECLRKGEVRKVITTASPGDRDNIEIRGPCYCTIEMINTSASTVDVGKNFR